MPHEFDHHAEARLDKRTAQGINHSNFLEMGPDSDEVWEILDIYWQVVLAGEAEDTAPTYGRAWWQMDIGEELLIDQADDLAAGTGFDVNSDRVLDSAFHLGDQAHVDDANNQTAPRFAESYSAHLQFSPGDVELIFPGELKLRGAVRFDAEIAHETFAKVSVHYAPRPRHS